MTQTVKTDLSQTRLTAQALEYLIEAPLFERCAYGGSEDIPSITLPACASQLTLFLSVSSAPLRKPIGPAIAMRWRATTKPAPRSHVSPGMRAYIALTACL